MSDIHSDSPISSAPSGPSGPSGLADSSNTLRRGRRSIDSFDVEDNVEAEQEEHVEIVDEEISESVARQQPAEEQWAAVQDQLIHLIFNLYFFYRIAEFMFAFLGLDSKACRRRFVCEMEFRSKLNPLTSMAFRIVGRGFFEKYTNSRNPQRRATNFQECAAVNPECVFVANEEPEITPAVDEEESTEASESTNQEDAAETQNEINLQAERRLTQLKRRRGDRMLSPIAEHILTQ